MAVSRCGWATNDPLYIAYHDREWGSPLHDGLGIGAEIDLMAFFTSRYFGLRDYAKLYGAIFGIFALGVGIGPALSGASFDRFHSYTPAFALFVILLAIGCLVFLRLGPYPFPALGEAVSGAAEKMPA